MGDDLVLVGADDGGRCGAPGSCPTVASGGECCGSSAEEKSPGEGCGADGVLDVHVGPLLFERRGGDLDESQHHRQM